MPLRIAFGRVVIVAERSSRGRWNVKAFESDEAQNLTKLVDFAPREMSLGKLMDQLEDLASEAETVRLKRLAEPKPRSKPTPRPQPGLKSPLGVVRGSIEADGRFEEPVPEDELARREDEASIGRVERLARFVAVKGRAEAERLHSIATRAVELLDDPRLQESIALAKEEAESARFSWQFADEKIPLGTPLGIYLASCDDYATGEGLTVYFAAGCARGESEYRRKLAVEWGAALADRAHIAQGADAEVPFAALFVTPALRAAVEKVERREDGPGAFSFFARQHANYS